MEASLLIIPTRAREFIIRRKKNAPSSILNDDAKLLLISQLHLLLPIEFTLAIVGYS